MFETLISELRRLQSTARWSWQGWATAWASEKSLRQWTGLFVASVVLALLLDLSTAERALVIGFGALVLVAELFNSAIEETVNRISLEQHPLSKKAKDIASAGVAVTAIAAGLVWLIVLLG